MPSAHADNYKARNFASMALKARNAISHLAIGLQDDEALRYLDAMHQLLKLVKAPAGEIADLKNSTMPATIGRRCGQTRLV
jgi:hypothetical protein